jgi:hypothetical protein
MPPPPEIVTMPSCARRGNARRAGIGDVDRFSADPARQAPVIAKHGVINRIAAGKRRCVASRRGGARLRAPDLDRHDGLASAPCLLQRFDQGTAVTRTFQVEDHDLRLGIVHDGRQAFRRLHVAFVAGRDPIAETEAPLASQIVEMRPEGAALADDRQRPRSGSARSSVLENEP